MSHTALIEAILFYRGEPESVARLAKLADISVEEARTALEELKGQLEGRGIALIFDGETAQLVTAPVASERIEAVRKAELTKDLGKAGAETLAIVLYQGPVSRAQIDYIRGVNSSFILRNLMIRGLIERAPAREGGRATNYRATPALYAHLGLTGPEALPEFAEVRSAIEKFETEAETEPEGAAEAQ